MDDIKQLVLRVVGTCYAVAQILSHSTERARVSLNLFVSFSAPEATVVEKAAIVLS